MFKKGINSKVKYNKKRNDKRKEENLVKLIDQKLMVRII